MVVINSESYLSKQEFADAIGVSYNTVTNWAYKNKLPPAYISEGSRCFYTQEQVDKYWRGEYVPVRNKV